MSAPTTDPADGPALAHVALGIDLGTSSVKSVLVGYDAPDDPVRVLGEASAPLEVSRPHPGWSEQDPEAWWQATLATLDALIARDPVPFRRLRSIGLSGQMHGATLLDADGRVLRPAILWNDVRSTAECAAMEQALPATREISGNAVMPGFTAPKLLWVREHEPDLFARIGHVLLPKDYVRFRLTGAFVSDMSDSAGTIWLDTGRRAWSDALLGATGLTRAQMPDLVEGSAPGGMLSAALARRFGTPDGVVVAGGAGDNAAAACGIGAVSAGDAFLSLGTSGVLFAATEGFRPNVAGGVHTFCHAIPDTWHQMGVILSATDSLQWLARLLDSDARTLTSALGERVARPSPAMFLPYLSGERTPHNDGRLRGGFAGLGHEADRAVMTQAVLEGVAYAFRDCQRVLADAGTRIERAWAVGGGAASRLWLRIMASVLGIPLLVPDGAALGAALGAARLAIAAATGADPRAICAAPEIAETIEPDPGLVLAYTEGYARFRALHPALQEFARP